MHEHRHSPFPGLQSIYDTVIGFRALNTNWDGGRACTIDNDAIHRTLGLLETGVTIFQPQSVEPLPTGRIRLRWSNGQGDLTIEIVPHRERYIYQYIPLCGECINPPQEVVGIHGLLTVLIPFLFPILVSASPPSPHKITVHQQEGHYPY